MASRWMAPKLAKMARERKANAPVERAQRFNNLRLLNMERDAKGALIALAASATVKVVRCKPADKTDRRDVGKEGKRRRSFDHRTFGDFERRGALDGLQSYETTLLVVE